MLHEIILIYILIKKENQIFLIYKEIQSGAVAKSYMRKRKGFLIYEEMRKNFPIYEEAVSLTLTLLHSEFLFFSVHVFGSLNFPPGYLYRSFRLVSLETFFPVPFSGEKNTSAYRWHWPFPLI